MAAREVSTGQGGAENAGVEGGPATSGLRQRVAMLLGRVLPGGPVQPLLFRLAVLAGFFAVAALASWQYRNQNEEANNAVPAASESKGPAKAAPSANSPLDLLARADLALRQYRFAVALSLYEELRTSSPDHGPLIDYRFALCNESMGQYDNAIAGYRLAISGPRSAALSFACHLGLARCLFCQGQFAEARRQLYPFLLDESRQRDVPQVFVSDARYLIALSLSREQWPAAEAEKARRGEGGKGIRAGSVSDGPGRGPSLTLPARIPSSPFSAGPLATVSSIGLTIPYYLDELGAETLAAEPSAEEKAAGAKKKIEAPPADAKKKAEALGIVRGLDLDEPAVKAIQRLATESGYSIELSADADRALAERSLRLCVTSTHVDDLLEPIADYFGLVFRTDGVSRRRICASAEIDAKQLTALQRDRCIRALRGVLLTDAAHAWKTAACLELGNWEAVQGRTSEALAWFERLARESSSSPYAPAAYFNQALIHLDKQDIVAARTAFFRVVDHSPGHDLALKAYIRIGMSYMENDEFKEAIFHLRHAQAMAPRSPQHAFSTVTLAAAYLLNKQPEATRAVLLKERTVFQKNPCKATAAFLDGYAQYQLAKEASLGRREASDLLSTLLRDQDQTVLGPLGDFIVAQAYRDLGFWGHAEQILRQTSKQAQGNLARAVEYTLADTLLQEQQREEATKMFEKLMATPSSYASPARLQLAQIKLQDKHCKECADLCREIWKERSRVDTPTVLQVWGTALEGMGEFGKAALCYAGKPPE